jgi:hypothetical protein
MNCNLTAAAIAREWLRQLPAQLGFQHLAVIVLRQGRDKAVFANARE